MVAAIGKEAGLKIREIKNRGFQKQNKEDGSPVTEADLAAHSIILEGLTQISDFPVLSEEGVVDWSERRSWEKYWLVDPLDGTKDFIKGTGEYTVNIALVENGHPTLGVIYVPEKDLLYSGGVTTPTTKNFQQINPSAKTKRPANKRRTAVESHFHSSDKNKAFYQKHGIENVMKAGSSLKFCQLAEGGADIYPRFGPTMEWDTAAGQAILEGVGGQVFRWPERTPLEYGKQDLRNPHFIALAADTKGLLK